MKNNLTFGQLIKTIQKEDENTWFQVPENYPPASTIVNRVEAGKKLAILNLSWKEQKQTTTFNIYKEDLVDVWDKDELRRVNRKVISIAAENPAILDFATHMNTMGD